jgi:sugar/nucleoside kinase (ribokinase family)
MTSFLSQPPDLVCLGALMIDFVGQDADVDVEHTTAYRRYIGGACANVAATAVGLGCRTAVVSRIGEDAFGEWMRDELRRLRIADRWLQIDPVVRSSVIFFSGAPTKRDFLLIRGADQYLALDDATRTLLRTTRALHTTTFALSQEPCRSAAIEAIEIVHAAGNIVSLDPNFKARSWPDRAELMPLLRRLLPMTTMIKPSLQDAEAIWGAGQTPGDYIEQFHAHGARQIMLTLGHEGVVVSDGSTVERIPAMPFGVPSASGVGDAFTAAAIVALLHGESLTGAARLGTIVAGYRLRNKDLAAPLPALPTLFQQVRSNDEVFPAVSMRN